MPKQSRQKVRTDYGALKVILTEDYVELQQGLSVVRIAWASLASLESLLMYVRNVGEKLEVINFTGGPPATPGPPATAPEPPPA